MAEKGPGSSRKKPSVEKKQALDKQAKPVTPISQGSPGQAAKQLDARKLQEDIESQVRLRAYELFEERGRREGFADEDWARAEAEVLSRYQRGKSA